MMHEQACCREAARHQLPIAAAFWSIQIVTAEECSSLTQNLMQIHCSTCSVIFNVMATQYTSSLNGIYRPHWPVQWSCHCSHMCIPVHSPWLLGYIKVMQNILVILTMAGLFPNRPRVSATTTWQITPKWKRLIYNNSGDSFSLQFCFSHFLSLKSHNLYKRT